MLPSSPSNSASVDDCLIVCDKVIATEELEPKQRLTARVVQYHTKARISEMNRIGLIARYPFLAEALEQLPEKLALPRRMGIYMSPMFYKGVKRSGKLYLNRWLEENHIEASPTVMLILGSLAFYGDFTTYDDLFKYLEFNHCGELQPEITHDPKQAVFKSPDSTDLEWLNSETRKKAIAAVKDQQFLDDS